MALSHEHEQFYHDHGYVLVPGLIPQDIAAEAEAAMLRLLGVAPGQDVVWQSLEQRHQSYEEPALLACFTAAYCAAAAQLAGDDTATCKPPARAYAINVFPREAEWHWPGPHIDHAIKEHGHHVFPRAFRVASMAFLSDVPPHGGGTVVWPGSHRRLEKLARSDPQHYEMMWTLNQDLSKAALGEPVELTPRRGDVLFYHYLCAHAGSMNTSDRPRLALNMKW